MTRWHIRRAVDADAGRIGEITVAGQKVATQSSREYLTSEKSSFIRDVNLQLAIGAGAPVHFIAVYDRK